MGKRSVGTVIIGNMLEFYDFNLVLVYSFVLSKTFFPDTGSLLVSVYRSMGVFILGVIARPLGALLFGYIGDLYGRKQALCLSVFLMALPSTAITILPGYKTIGIVAPIVFIFARIIQGLCTGGEYNGAAIYSLESTTQRQGLISGLITASGMLGVVLASSVQLILQLPIMPANAWRFAFLLGTGIALFGIYMRTQLLDSPTLKNKAHKKQKRTPLIEAWTYHRKSLMLTFFVAGQLSVIGYILLAGGPALLKLNESFDSNLMPLLTLGGAIIYASTCIMFGWLSDYINKQTTFIKAASILSVGIIPFSLWSYKSPHLSFIMAGHSFMAVLAGLAGSTQHRFYQNLFPVHLRYTGIGVSFWLGTGILALCVPVWCLSPSTPWLWPIIYTLFTGSVVWLWDRKQTLARSHLEKMI